MMRTDAAAIAPPCNAVQTARTRHEHERKPQQRQDAPSESPANTFEIATASVTPVAIRATLIPRPSRTEPTIARHSVRASRISRRSKARPRRASRRFFGSCVVPLPLSCSRPQRGPDAYRRPGLAQRLVHQLGEARARRREHVERDHRLVVRDGAVRHPRRHDVDVALAHHALLAVQLELVGRPR